MNSSKMLSFGLLSLLVFQTQCSWSIKEVPKKIWNNKLTTTKVVAGLSLLGLAGYACTRNEPVIDTGLTLLGHTLISNKEVIVGAGLAGLGSLLWAAPKGSCERVAMRVFRIKPSGSDAIGDDESAIRLPTSKTESK